MNVLEVRGLQVSFPGGLSALRGVDVTVRSGEILALVGESGSGKSVLALAALGLLPSSALLSGHVRLGGADMVTATDAQRRAARRRSAGAVFQDPMTSLNPTMRVGRQVAEVTGSPREAVDLLDQVGVPEPGRRARQYPHELSGGLRQRVMIAMALAGDPALVIADEPTTALDVTVQAGILELFRELRDSRGTSFVLVTHDLAVAGEVADRIAVLYAGRMAEVGAAGDVLRRPSHPYTAALLAARITTRSARSRPLPTLAGELPDPHNPEPGCAFAPRCGAAQQECRTVVPALEPSPRHAGQDACIRSSQVELLADASGLSEGPGWQRPSTSSELALQLTGVNRTFGRGRRSQQVLRGVSLDVPKGGAVALVGESGCGKSTTLRIAVGLDSPDSGDVEYGHGGRPQLVFQDAGASLTPWATIGELLAQRLRNERVPQQHWRDRTVETLRLVGLSERIAERKPHQISGGQRQRAAIARAIVVPPVLLACDEPISALDTTLAAVVLNLLGRLRRELGMALLFVTHDLAAARVVADEIAVMVDGRIVERGPADQLLDRPNEAYTRRLVDALPRMSA
ncbi:MAG: peptide/nickel transport system ATP-binding protein ddpF [Frankiales bacterium]|jgi:peptide/nickel transport system ATP-binding protein|nr:peptide/nickel transport system ATP-binding protein ddpF [Frankiales bacterium]